MEKFIDSKIEITEKKIDEILLLEIKMLFYILLMDFVMKM